MIFFTIYRWEGQDLLNLEGVPGIKKRLSDEISMRWICYNLFKDFLTCLRLLQSSTDNFFSSDPFKPSGSSSDSKKTTDSKDLSSSAKDPFNNPFGSDPFGEFTTIFFYIVAIQSYGGT